MKVIKTILKTLITIVVFIIVLYFLFVATDVFLPSTKEVKNAEQLKTEIINQVVSRLRNNDTLYLATNRSFGVCGNDPRYDDIVTFSEKVQDIKYLLDNPYYINFSKYHEMTYSVNAQTIIFGRIIDNNFISKNNNFEIISNSPNRKKEIYEIVYLSIKKDEVIINLIDSHTFYKPKKNEEKIKFIKVNSEWKVI